MDPSQHEANRIVAALKGEVKKYTVSVYMKSGRVYEYQSDRLVDTKYDSTTETQWLTDGYEKMVAKFEDVEFVNQQENPK